MSKKVASLNINGFGSLARDHPLNKWGMIHRLMTDKKIAVMLLQETHLTEERKNTIERMFGKRLKIFHSPDPTNPTQRTGVAIVVNKRLASVEGAKATVIEPGRSPGEERTFLAVYAPANGAADRADFFRKLRQHFERYTHLKRPDVMGGDFNMVEDMIDLLPMTLNGSPDQEEFDDLKRELHLKITDRWRATFPDERAYTFLQIRRDGPHLARLDRIYCSNQTFASARQWTISEPGVKTDHSLVSVQITCEKAPAVGKGQPRLAEWVIKDKKFATFVKERGRLALSEVCSIEQCSEANNPVKILQDFCRDIFKVGREREKAIVPAAQKKIKASERTQD
ncbi:Endonuclease/exonuclease/phosphatase [Schizophyllum fasciatum]